MESEPLDPSLPEAEEPSDEGDIEEEIDIADMEEEINIYPPPLPRREVKMRITNKGPFRPKFAGDIPLDDEEIDNTEDNKEISSDQLKPEPEIDQSPGRTDLADPKDRREDESWEIPINEGPLEDGLFPNSTEAEEKYWREQAKQD